MAPDSRRGSRIVPLLFALFLTIVPSLAGALSVTQPVELLQPPAKVAGERVSFARVAPAGNGTV